MKIVRPDLLDKPMTRAEFLKNIGIGAVLFLGGGVIMQYFGGVDITQTPRRGYGLNTYGARIKTD